MKKKVLMNFWLKKKSFGLTTKLWRTSLPDEDIIKEKKNENNDVKITLGDEKIEIDVPIKNSKPTPLEKSVLEKIK